MAYRKRYCVGDCNFAAYYQNQAGGALSDINIFRGVPYQRGYGIGSIFKRFGIPLLKFLGRNILKTGMAIGADVLANGNIKDIVKTRAKQGVKSTVKEGLAKASQMVDQVGTGRKRKSLYKAPKKPRKKARKKDIFS